MRFQQMMGFKANSGTAVRGHAWNFLSVSSHHSLFDTIFHEVPETKIEWFCQSAAACYSWESKASIRKDLASKYILVKNHMARGKCKCKRSDPIIAGKICLVPMFLFAGFWFQIKTYLNSFLVLKFNLLFAYLEYQLGPLSTGIW